MGGCQQPADMFRGCDDKQLSCPVEASAPRARSCDTLRSRPDSAGNSTAAKTAVADPATDACLSYCRSVNG